MNVGKEELKTYFWDIDFKSLDFEKFSFYVIERLLEFGDEKATEWMIDYYGTEKVKEVVKKSRNISKKTANLWSIVLEIPFKEIECMKKSSQKRQEKFWNY
ncbi:MAG: hypothetical protein AB1410_04195 [Acidobacteriota bacterium]